MQMHQPFLLEGLQMDLLILRLLARLLHRLHLQCVRHVDRDHDHDGCDHDHDALRHQHLELLRYQGLPQLQELLQLD